jgi:hypothetical protein
VKRTRRFGPMPSGLEEPWSSSRFVRHAAAERRAQTRTLIRLALAGSLLAVLLPPHGASAAGGNRRWTATYDDPASDWDAASAIARSPTGDAVFVTGSSAGSSGGSQIATISYDTSTGSALWTTRGHASGSTSASDIVGTDDEVFVAGAEAGDMLTVAYDASSGAELWSVTYDGPLHSEDDAVAIAPDTLASRVFITGSSAGQGYSTIAYDMATGAQLWAAGGPSGTGIAVSPSGSRVFVAGTTRGGRWAATAYRAGSGQQLWRRSFAGSSGPVDISRGGGIVLAGQSASGALIVRALKPRSGGLVWKDSQSVPGGTFVTDMAVSPRGNWAFVTATFGTDPAGGFLTIGYVTRTGRRLWVDRVQHTGFPTGVAVGSRMHHLLVVVTGRIEGSLETISYRAGSGHTRWSRHLKHVSFGADVVIGRGGVPFVTGSVRPGRSKNYLTIAYSP